MENSMNNYMSNYMGNDMVNDMGNYMNSSLDFTDHMEKMYPDSYTKIYPHVQYAVNSLSDEKMYNLTNEDIDFYTDDVVNKSAVLNDPPMGHNRNTVRDFARALFIRDLFDRHRRNRSFPFFPFFFFPFDGRDHDRGRDFDHRMRDRY